jgi:hypothetical protein
MSSWHNRGFNEKLTFCILKESDAGVWALSRAARHPDRIADVVPVDARVATQPIWAKQKTGRSSRLLEKLVEGFWQSFS